MLENTLVPIVIMTGMFAMVYGIVYLYRRERMAMIERGMDPRNYKPKAHNYNTLKWGLLLIGSGLGLFLAFVLDHTWLTSMDYDSKHNPSIYFALIAMFGGIGLLISHLVERKDLPVNRD